MSNKWLNGSIIFLAGSIIFGSILISNSINSISKINSTETTLQKNNDILNIPEAAKFINVSEDKIIWLLENSRSIDGNGIPYYKVDDKVYFSKIKLAEWIVHVSENNMEF